MVKSKFWRRAPPPAGPGRCPIAGCAEPPQVAVAGEGPTATLMCLRHTRAWVESTSCCYLPSVEALWRWIAAQPLAGPMAQAGG